MIDASSNVQGRIPRTARIAGLVGVICVSAAAIAEEQSATTPRVIMDLDGTVQIPSLTVPLSTFMSPEAKKAFIDIHEHPPAVVQTAGIAKFRESLDKTYLQPRIDRARQIWAVDIEPKTIDSVYTEIITPKGGVPAKNKDRILIELHGGGFSTGARTNGQLESIPIAGSGKCRVIAVDYREGPENKFPAASEDVATVYKELLKTYKPADIGIYGCSAGGILAGQAVAWFQKHDLPRPGAVGIFCASVFPLDGGDSTYLAASINGQAPRASGPSRPTAGMTMAYFSGVDMSDPLVAPGVSPEILAKFPPTLLITGTRDVMMSGAVHTDTALTKAGVKSELHVWDGMGHFFFGDTDLPESKEAFDAIAKFFDRHLGS